MRFFTFAVLAAFGAQAGAQSIEGTIVEDNVLDIACAASFLDEHMMYGNFAPRDSVVNEFCYGNSSSTFAMVLSSRITEDEAVQCYGNGASRVTEVFSRDRGSVYIYFNLEADPWQLREQYLTWTDPNLQINAYDLLEFLGREYRLLPNVLRGSNRPDTCARVSGSDHACRDGTYCCNSICILNDQDC